MLQPPPQRSDLMASTYKPFSQYVARSVDLPSLEDGDVLEGSAASRRLLNATNATSAPAAATDGFAVSGVEQLYIKLKATGNNCTVVLWEWDATSEQWAVNATLGTVSLTAGASPTLVRATVDGSHRAALQVSTAVGAGQFDGWCRAILRPRG
jgi:hypothetical protein